MITPLKIVILIASWLVLVGFILTFVFHRYYWSYAQTIPCYLAEFFMYIGALIAILAAIFDLSNKAYKNALVFLYFADVFSLASIFIFAFWPFYRFHEYVSYFNWAAVVSFYVIIALIGLVHVYLIKNHPPATITMTIPVNQLNQVPLQPSYQQPAMI